jgi:Flp pilus assembly pilin Flp
MNEKRIIKLKSSGPQAGISLTEYALLIGLISVFGIFGLKSFGNSIHQLFSGAGSHLETDNTLILLQPNQGNVTTKLSPAKLSLKGGKYYSIVTDPKTGMPSLKLTSGAEGIAVNTTSTDGQFNTLGTVMLAQSLDQLAQNETDPKKKDYYTRLADLSFYLGGAEGEMDSVPNLDLAITNEYGTYTRGDALRDIYAYRQEIKALMKNPPENMSKDELMAVLPLATDVYNISQTYLNAYSKFIDRNGNVPGNFGLADACTGTTCRAGNGTPGSCLSNADKVTFLPNANKMINMSYDQLVTPTQIRSASNVVLSSKQVESARVENTLTDATLIDTQRDTTQATAGP